MVLLFLVSIYLLESRSRLLESRGIGWLIKAWIVKIIYIEKILLHKITKGFTIIQICAA